MSGTYLVEIGRDGNKAQYELSQECSEIVASYVVSQAGAVRFDSFCKNLAGSDQPLYAALYLSLYVRKEIAEVLNSEFSDVLSFFQVEHQDSISLILERFEDDVASDVAFAAAVASLQASYYKSLVAFESGVDGVKKPRSVVNFISEHEELVDEDDEELDFYSDDE